MQLNDIVSQTTDQQLGQWLDLLDPVTGEQSGIRLKIAGPDSETQNSARLRLADDLSAVAGADGRVTAAQREAARLDSLARCVLDWEVSENDEPVPFSHGNVLRLLRAAAWVQAQVDAFAGDRAMFRGAD